MAYSYRIVTTLPVVDIDRARKFYEVKLRLNHLSATSSGVLYECGSGTTVPIYEGQPSKAKHVVAAFEVENITEKVTQLRNTGITVYENDMPGIDTLANVATIG